MSAKENYANKMRAAGVCDERGAAFCATAVQLPNGAYGMCLLGVKGNELSIYDTDMKSSVGELICRIPLQEITNLEVTNGLLLEIFKGYSFRFDYNDFTYTFKNCAQQKAALAIIRSETE